MRQTLRSALFGPGTVLLPLLTLPVLVGGLVLLLAPEAARAGGRFAVAFGAVAVTWYLLGGALTLARLRMALRARLALRRLRPMLEAAADPVWACDRHGVVVWQNAAADATWGEGYGRPVTAVIARLAADADGVVARLLDRGHGGDIGMPLGSGWLTLSRHAGGDLQLWRLNPALVEAPAAPATPTERPEDVFRRLPVALLRLDSRGRVLRANAAAVDLLGPLEPGSMLGAILDGLGRPVEDWVDDVAHGRTEPRPEVLRRRGPGPERFVQVALTPDGAEGLLAVCSDASAIKTLEAQFVQSQKMQAIGQLAGGIAHDFNNLLTAITGHVDLLMLRRDKSDPDYADLDQISQNANRAASLVGQLLAFSRKQTLKPRLIDLRDTLSDLTHLLNRLVGERVALVFEHDPALCPIRADRRQLEQVVMNLVVNARDAMPAGGRITIATRNVTLGRATARERVAVPKGRWVCVTVSDQGVGIPPDRLDKIFEPFFTTKRTGEGTGLGLSTVYGIVKQTGGYVFCDSTPGSGTTFSIYFPAHARADLAAAAAVEAKEAAARAAATCCPGEDARRSPGRVLLVEDEAPVRAFAGRALRLKGFEVLEADSAEAALKLLADDPRKVDVFVTDVVMPGMDGPSWVRSALRDRPATRVVFISGYTEDVFNDGRSPIPDAVFLQKPFSLAALTDTVRQLYALGAASGEGAVPDESAADASVTLAR